MDGNLYWELCTNSVPLLKIWAHGEIGYHTAPARRNFRIVLGWVHEFYKCSITIEELNSRINEWEKKYGKYENKIDYTFIQDYLNSK